MATFHQSINRFRRENVGRFIPEDALPVWTNLDKHSLFVCYRDGHKTHSVVRRSRRTTEDSSSRRIMCLVPVYILETHNQTNNECLSKFVLMDHASASQYNERLL